MTTIKILNLTSINISLAVDLLEPWSTIITPIFIFAEFIPENECEHLKCPMINNNNNAVVVSNGDM